MSGLFTELREIARERKVYEDQNTPFCRNASAALLTQAADEIERLQADAAAIRRAIEAMSQATRTYRKVKHLPGKSTEVAGWVHALDQSQVELAKMLEGA